MNEIIRGIEGIRTVVFPESVTKIRDSAFSQIGSIKSAVFREGLAEPENSVCHSQILAARCIF